MSSAVLKVMHTITKNEFFIKLFVGYVVTCIIELIVLNSTYRYRYTYKHSIHYTLDLTIHGQHN